MTEDVVEQWLPVVGYEGLYEVSDIGRVRSLDRAVWRDDARCSSPHYVTYRGRQMRLGQQRHGYVGVVLWRDGKYRSVRVHRLVLEAFVGPCPPGMETLHGNGRRNDNRLANLRWGTPEENAEDRVRHGTCTWTPRRSASGVDLCKRNHPLAGPNVRSAAANQGRQGCLSCSRALSSWYWFNSKNPGHDKEQWLQERADRNYQQLISQAGAA